MILLGIDIGDYDQEGFDWNKIFRNWFKDPCYDLRAHSSDDKIIQVLNKFQSICDRTGATNTKMAEYFNEIENRLDQMLRPKILSITTPKR